MFLLISYGLIFGLPKQVAFAYSGSDCTRQLTLFPQTMKQVTSSNFQVEFTDTVLVMGQPILSLKACFTALEPPTEGTNMVQVSPLGYLFMKRYAVEVEPARAASLADFVGKTLPTTRPIAISLNGIDTVFDYKFMVEDKMVGCTHEASLILCDMEKLALVQGETYEGTLARYFNEKKLAELGSGKFTTLQPLVLGVATVSESQTIYDKPTELSFEYDKILDLVEAELTIKNGEVYEPVAITISTDDKRAIITPEEPLKRNALFQLTLKKVEAEDGSAIPAPYIVNFTLSGGPKVTGINTGSISTPQSGSIILTFDQEIANDSQITKLVTVQGIDAQILKDGQRIILTYTNAPRCTDFTITVKKGLESQHGIVQEEDWTFSSRTICYYTQTFGYSQQGRPLSAWVFGSGSKTILYTGAIHGNEQGTRSLMYAWINELEVNARSIPADVQIVVVPSVNPDGVAANIRANANNVDLNRNFNVSDWKQDIVTPGNQPWPGGGGNAPMSEPETQALAVFTSSLAPYLTLSYHGTAGYAIGNSCGGSAGLAASYASLSGYANMTGVVGAFSYEITGTYDDWLCESLGRQSVLVELATNSSEFSRNRLALWAMARS